MMEGKRPGKLKRPRAVLIQTGKNKVVAGVSLILVEVVVPELMIRLDHNFLFQQPHLQMVSLRTRISRYMLYLDKFFKILGSSN